MKRKKPEAPPVEQEDEYQLLQIGKDVVPIVAIGFDAANNVVFSFFPGHDQLSDEQTYDLVEGFTARFRPRNHQVLYVNKWATPILFIGEKPPGSEPRGCLDLVNIFRDYDHMTDSEISDLLERIARRFREGGFGRKHFPPTPEGEATAI